MSHLYCHFLIVSQIVMAFHCGILGTLIAEKRQWQEANYYAVSFPQAYAIRVY